MNGIELLRIFAKEEGIDSNRVDAFLNKFQNPNTIEDLMKLPHDMLNHFNYINDVDGELYEYLKSRDYNRYQVINLDSIADSIHDNMWYVKSKLEKGTISEEEARTEIDKYEAIERQLINLKFGSIEYDW